MSLRTFALVNERIHGCNCNPDVDIATAILPDGNVHDGVSIVHEEWCPRAVPTGVVIPHIVWGTS
jgi:hypothetical protein